MGSTGTHFFSRPTASRCTDLRGSADNLFSREDIGASNRTSMHLTLDHKVFFPNTSLVIIIKTVRTFSATERG